MRSIIGVLAVILLAPALAPAQEVRFPRAALDETSYHQTVPPVRAFLQTLKKLDAEAAFDTGQGTEPRDDLGGLSAKQWLMSHVAPDFACRRDFGGTCESDDALVRFSYVFLSDLGWSAIGDAGPDPRSAAGLSALSLSFRGVLYNTDLADGDGESCVPAIARTNPDLEAVMAGLLGPGGVGLLEAHDNFIGIYGRYRIRAAPSLSAPVLGGISSEVVFLPGPGETVRVTEDGQTLTWTYIVPAEGPAGFAALEDFDILALSAVATPQLCVAMRGGQVVITAHAGAGD